MSSNNSLLGSSDLIRFQQINSSKTFCFWSIKNQKLIRMSKTNFRKGQCCELCIPVYSATSNLKICDKTFDYFSMYRQHILSMENVFKRQLIWVTESEVPNDLVRERELGDFSTLEDHKILKIVFDSLTLVQYQSVLKEYFSKYGCPCENHTNSKCKVRIGQSYGTMFSHLCYLERYHRKYFVFKANVNEITRENTANLKSAQSKKMRNHTRKRVLLGRIKSNNLASKSNSTVLMNQSLITLNQSLISLNQSLPVDYSLTSLNQSLVPFNQFSAPINSSIVSANHSMMTKQTMNELPTLGQIASLNRLSSDYITHSVIRKNQSPTVSSTCLASAISSENPTSFKQSEQFQNTNFPKTGCSLSTLKKLVNLKQKSAKLSSVSSKSTSGLSTNSSNEMKLVNLRVSSENQNNDQPVKKPNETSTIKVKRLLICGKVVEITFNDLADQNRKSTSALSINESTNEKSSMNQKLMCNNEFISNNETDTNRPIEKKTLNRNLVKNHLDHERDVEMNLMETVNTSVFESE